MTENTILKLNDKKIKLGKDIISVENLKIQICTKFGLKSIEPSSISLNYEYQNKSFDIVTNHNLNNYVSILESLNVNNAPCINIILPKIILSNYINQNEICQEDEESSLSSLRNDSPTCFRNQNVTNIKKLIPNVAKRNKNKKSNPKKEIKDENNEAKEFYCENRISDDLKKLFTLLKKPLPESKIDQRNDFCIGNDYPFEMSIPRARAKGKKTEICELILNGDYKFEEITKVLNSYDNHTIIEIKRNYKKQYFELEDFNLMCSKDVFNKLTNDISCGEIRVINSNANSDTLLYLNFLNKHNSSNKKKFLYKNRQDYLDNHDNCFFWATKFLCPYINKSKFRLAFKNLSSIKEQIDLANNIIRKNYQKLLYKCNEEEVLRKYILTVKNPSLIIFWNDPLVIHAEAVKNGDYMQVLQDRIKKLQYKKVKIIHYELINVDLDLVEEG